MQQGKRQPERYVPTPRQTIRLLAIGQRMSNWLHNLKQMHDLPEHIRTEAEFLQTEWDAARVLRK